MGLSMTRPRLALDVDGVMYSWDKTARYLLRTERGYPKDGPLGQPSSHWNAIQQHVSKEDWQWLWGTGVKMGLFRYGHLFPGTIEAVRELSTIGDLVVITHRPRSAVQDTIDWLSYLRLPFTETHLLTSQQPKSQIKCDLYLDDKPENIFDFQRNTTGLPLMWLRPWNAEWVEGFATGQLIVGDSVRTNDKWVTTPVVQSWDEVIAHARELKV